MSARVQSGLVVLGIGCFLAGVLWLGVVLLVWTTLWGALLALALIGAVVPIILVLEAKGTDPPLTVNEELQTCTCPSRIRDTRDGLDWEEHLFGCPFRRYHETAGPVVRGMPPGGVGWPE